MSELGQIITRIFTARAELPVVGATVTISQRNGGPRHTLLAIRITDENGKTPPVSIPAPPAWESLQPGTPSPFTLCDVRVEHPLYQLELVENVQIFAGVETLQEVALIPLAEHEIPRNSYDVVDITPQPL